MIQGIETFYQRIADAMTSEIPEEWSKAIFEATFYPGKSTYNAEYERSEDGKPRSFLPTDDGDAAVRELRKLFEANGKPLWGRMKFTLDCGGKFGIQFDYEQCDGNGDAIYRREEYLKGLEDRRKRLGAK